jgi:assimilatory nitrate reductase catalytic subunit
VSLFALDALAPEVRRTLLAGRPADRAAVDPWICVCHSVTAGTIRRAIEGGCDNVAAVGAATRAGTNCGSCKPEIAALLRLASRVAA